MLMPAYHVQVSYLQISTSRQGRSSVECMSTVQRHCTPSDHYCLNRWPDVSAQERLLDDDGQMWMSFKERLMYWERQIQLTSQIS